MWPGAEGEPVRVFTLAFWQRIPDEIPPVRDHGPENREPNMVQNDNTYKNARVKRVLSPL